MKADANLLKELRRTRADWVRRASATAKEQAAAVRSIKKALNPGAATVPDLAAATGLPTATVLWYLATLKKYGQVIESGKSGDYFAYALSAPAAEAGAEEEEA